MATVGLRAWTRGRPLVWAAARRYVRAPNHQFFISDFGLFTDYIPAPLSQEMSSLTASNIFSRLRRRVVEAARTVAGLATLKFYLRGWNRPLFASQAEELYGSMNGAFACGDDKFLKGVCSPRMLASLAGEIKARRVALDWTKVRSLSKPRVVQTRCVRLAKGMMVSQVVVRIDQEQAVTQLRRATGGMHAADVQRGARKTTHVREYVVFEREITNPAAPWLIYGKIDVPGWDRPDKAAS